MPLTTTKEILLDAQKGGYAVGAFNFENMEMAAAIVAADFFGEQGVGKKNIRYLQTGSCTDFCKAAVNVCVGNR